MTEPVEVQADERPTPKRGRPSSLIEVTRQCDECGGDFKTKCHPVTGEVARGYPKRFCSQVCVGRSNSGTKAGDARIAYEASPLMCPCGEAISYEKRHVRQFCSPECRKKYATKRPSDPSKYVTFNCRTCGNEVTRRKKYGNGASKFCSNECAAKHTKRVQHITIRDFDIVLDSAYEALVWSALRVAKIPVERFDRQFAVEWSPGHRYGPDFWLPQHEVCIEVKGLVDDNDEARWSAFRSTGRRLIIIDSDDIGKVSPEWVLLVIGAP